MDTNKIVNLLENYKDNAIIAFATQLIYTDL